MKILFVLIIFAVVFGSMIIYFIVAGKRQQETYEPPFKYMVNGDRYTTEYGAKYRVKYLKSKGVDFQVKIHDGYRWKTFSPNCIPPSLE